VRCRPPRVIGRKRTEVLLAILPRRRVCRAPLRHARSAKVAWRRCGAAPSHAVLRRRSLFSREKLAVYAATADMSQEPPRRRRWSPRHIAWHAGRRRKRKRSVRIRRAASRGTQRRGRRGQRDLRCLALHLTVHARRRNADARSMHSAACPEDSAASRRPARPACSGADSAIYGLCLSAMAVQRRL